MGHASIAPNGVGESVPQKPRPVILNAVVQDITTMLRRYVGEDIELTTALDPGLAPVMADPSQMHQVLMNLVVRVREVLDQSDTKRRDW
jgi:hypothetical protein